MKEEVVVMRAGKRAGLNYKNRRTVPARISGSLSFKCESGIGIRVGVRIEAGLKAGVSILEKMT